MRPRGGYIGFNRVPAASALNSAASGVWTLREAEALKRAGTWPMTSDENFSSVLLLLHMNGTNGSTTFTDSSGSPKTVTANGNAQISTAQAKFAQSGLFDGTGDYLSVPSISLSGAFTLEFFVRWVTRKNFALLVAGDGANTQLFFGIKENQTGLRWGRTGVAEHGTGSFTWSNDVWYHVALVRNSSNAFKVFVDGSDVTDSSPTNSYAYSGDLQICGGAGGGFEANAYIDEFRITTVDRYAASFSPPAAPFPDN
jgi:hypothetical protein